MFSKGNDISVSIWSYAALMMIFITPICSVLQLSCRFLNKKNQLPYFVKKQTNKQTKKQHLAHFLGCSKGQHLLAKQISPSSGHIAG